MAVLAADSGYAAAKWGTRILGDAGQGIGGADQGEPGRHRGDRNPGHRVLGDAGPGVGISGHFQIGSARRGLIGIGGLLLAFAVIRLLGLSAPPA